MKLLETYLLYLALSEREWNTPEQNPDSFDIENFKDLLNDLDGLDKFKHMRHALQPSLYDVYIKNALGDYMGRPDTMNSKTQKHIGFKQFMKDLPKLKKAAKFAQKMKDKKPKNFFKDASKPGEMGDPGGDGGDGMGGI